VAALITGAVLLARVGLSNAIMELHVESEQLARSIEAERAEGSRLEVQYAVATSPSTIQEVAATQLNMHPDPQVEYLRIQTGE
jgi:cell division protein FtsL